jgi:hypothetical protein
VCDCAEQRVLGSLALHGYRVGHHDGAHQVDQADNENNLTLTEQFPVNFIKHIIVSTYKLQRTEYSGTSSVN